MYSRTESQFLGYQDSKLYYQRWTPKKSRGQLIITHGHGEHSESYQRLVDALEELGLSVFAWDWRGHGHSEGQRGFAQNFNDYCYDYESFMKHLTRNELLNPKLPTILLSHSMGGLIQLRSLLGHPEWSIAAQVLCSPLLGVAIEIPPYKQIIGETLQNILPKLTLSTGVLNEYLSRDPEVIKEFEHDVLRHARISSGAWFGAVEAMKYVNERPEKIIKPLLLQIPDQDQVVSSTSSQKYFEKLTCPKQIKIYRGYKHEIFNDLDRQIVFEDLKKYLSEFI